MGYSKQKHMLKTPSLGKISYFFLTREGRSLEDIFRLRKDSFMRNTYKYKVVFSNTGSTVQV